MNNGHVDYPKKNRSRREVITYLKNTFKKKTARSWKPLMYWGQYF